MSSWRSSRKSASTSTKKSHSKRMPWDDDAWFNAPTSTKTRSLSTVAPGGWVAAPAVESFSYQAAEDRTTPTASNKRKTATKSRSRSHRASSVTNVPADLASIIGVGSAAGLPQIGSQVVMGLGVGGLSGTEPKGVRFVNDSTFVSAWNAGLASEASLLMDKAFPKIAADMASGTKKMSEYTDKLVITVTDDFNKDSYAEALSPRFSDLLPINAPVSGRQYPSPMHYTEAMRMVNGARPGVLTGGMASIAQLNPTVSTCDMGRTQLDILVNQPHASIIESVAKQCSKEADEAKFMTTDTTLTKFHLSLWLALWAKYKMNSKYLNMLASTQGKLIVYMTDSESNTKVRVTEVVYGINEDGEGQNIVGIMLMIMRLMLNYIPKTDSNPIYMYDHYARPILAKYREMLRLTPI